MAENILSGDRFKPSRNEYDWLGSGIYFWEANPLRGLEYAGELRKRKRESKIKIPAVIGAVIDLGNCLDLTTTAGIQQVKDAYKFLVEVFETAEKRPPENSKDLMRRNLDCAVIEYLHQIRKEHDDAPIDTIKGVFTEGNEIYVGSGFLHKTHIQICVCNPENIIGVFRVEKRFLA